MAAEDHLSNAQFYDAPNGTRYHLRKEGWNTFLAHKVKPDAPLTTPSQARPREHLSVNPVGGLSFFDTNLGAPDKPDQPTVFKAVVNKSHQRRGLGSALFDFADTHAQAKYGKPLQHSSALSEDGKAFVEGHLRKRGENG
jgi:hypothetical protein